MSEAIILVLREKKKIKIWRLSIFFGILMGLVCWAYFAYDEFHLQPARQPAMEVSDGCVTNNVPREACTEHIVVAGDTLTGIAEKYNIDLDTLIGANDDLSELIQPGEQLKILPKKGVLYRVESGDSLWRIARLHRVEAVEIAQENHRESDVLEVGEELFIPGGEPLRKMTSSIPVSRTTDTQFILPTTGEISSSFGQRWGKMHKGLDIADAAGTPVTAALGGRVSHSGWISGYGYTVILEHRNGYVTLYGHMQELLVTPGMAVKQGQLIGKMGSTGNSTGPHVHFEVQKDGQIINPLTVLR